MNKNQKRVVTTFSNLIRGYRMFEAIHNAKIVELERSKKADKAQLDYHYGWLYYFQGEIARFQLTQARCGNETVVVR